MYFKGREIRSTSNPVSHDELVQGNTYFSLNFIDESMLIPTLEPVIYIGKNLERDDEGQVYFQDFDSHQDGASYHSATEDMHAVFFKGAEGETNHIFQFDDALEVLMVCYLRRKSRKPKV